MHMSVPRNHYTGTEVADDAAEEDEGVDARDGHHDGEGVPRRGRYPPQLPEARGAHGAGLQPRDQVRRVEAEQEAS